MAQSVEERREAARVRMAARRERERAEREAASTAAAKSAGKSRASAKRGDTRKALESSIAAARKWLVDSDDAALRQARRLADIVDAMTAAGDVVRELSAHRALSKVLNDLGLTPGERLRYELRSRKVAPETEEPSGGNEQAAGGNVTRFTRPAKRGRTA